MDGNKLHKTVLEILNELSAEKNSYLQAGVVLDKAKNRLNIKSIEEEQALLVYFGDLFRIGYLAWGYNLANPSPPFCHITDRGRAALAVLSRDPSNPDGYLAYLHKSGNLSPVTESYIREALGTYAAGCSKATAVMVGAAAESIILEIRDTLCKHFASFKKSPPSDLKYWRINKVIDCIYKIIKNQKHSMPNELFEKSETYWPAFVHQIRTSRNDAGHPANISNIDEATVHASLLIFPELLNISTKLIGWIEENFNPDKPQ